MRDVYLLAISSLITPAAFARGRVFLFLEMVKKTKKMMEKMKKRRRLASDIQGAMAPYEFDNLITKTRPHILEKICLSLDYETFKNCLSVNKAWRDVLTNKVFIPKVKFIFRDEIARDESTLCDMSEVGDTEGVRRILLSGLVNADCYNGMSSLRRTPLIHASYEGHVDIVRLLINAGADVNQDGPVHSYREWQESPMMVAACCNHFDVVKMLMEAGAKPDKADKFGKTPLMMAVNNNSKAVVQLLIDRGADIIHGDGLKAPMGLAEEKGHQEVLEMLFDAWKIKTGSRMTLEEFLKAAHEDSDEDSDDYSDEDSDEDTYEE